MNTLASSRSLSLSSSMSESGGESDIESEEGGDGVVPAGEVCESVIVVRSDDTVGAPNPVNYKSTETPHYNRND